MVYVEGICITIYPTIYLSRVYEKGIWITIYPTIYHYSNRRSSNLDPWSQRDGSGQKPFFHIIIPAKRNKSHENINH